MSSSDEERPNYSEDEDVSEDEIPEEEEEADEEEEKNLKKRKGREIKSKSKKKKKAIYNFIEDEADVDEDEEEDEMVDDDIYGSERALAEEAEVANQSYQYEPRRRMDYEEDDEQSAEAIVSSIKKRHQRSQKHYDEVDEGVDAMQSEVAQQSLLPSIQDPRMWVFKCKPGREQHLVISLMNKFLDLARQGQPLSIKSVIASSSKGFIYVEAEREPHAKDAVNGLRDISQHTMKLVPVQEMTSVLNVQKKRKPLAVGAWARIKRAGVFKGDLCKVLEIVDNGARAIIKMVPRHDPSVLSGGEAQKYKKGQRPPQKLLHSNMVHGDIVRRRYPATGEMMDFFDNDYYQDGFLVKEVNINMMLQTDEVNPRLDEINKFAAVAEREDDGNQELLASMETGDWKNKVELAKGDTVRVVEGDLVNLMGIVVSTNTANDIVRVMPLHEEIKDTILDFQVRQLIKYVKVGDHIKVVSGMYSGETGTVVAVDDSDGAPVAIVLVDSMAKEIQVRVQDLQESAEISHGLDSLKGIELYDLVALAQGDVGVVTHVGRDGFKVFTQGDQVCQVSDQEIQRKLPSSRAAALDQKHNYVSVGEMVNVLEGDHAGHAGTVKHIHRCFLFLHNNRVMTNAGMFVARAHQVILSGSKARSNMIQNSTLPRMNGARPPRNDRRNAREHEMIGKTVKMKKGRWKGYIGIVVDESEQKVKVEIHCKATTVDVDRQEVVLAGTRQGQLQDKPRRIDTPMAGATPLPSQTPLHGSAMTPMATPLHRSLGTPQAARASDAWNIANDDALLETQLNHEEDITHATSFGAPLEPVGTMHEGLASRSFGHHSIQPMGTKSPTRESAPFTPTGNPTTPGLNPTTPGLLPRTPAFMMGSHPTTPGLNPTTPGLHPTTPAHLSATPAHGREMMGSEPRTPGFGVATPGIGLNPTTPSLATPGYQHNPTTPGLYRTPMNGLASSDLVATPGVSSGLMANGVGGMPVPQPHTREAHDILNPISNEVTWKMKGVEVSVAISETGVSIGVIASVHADTLVIEIDGNMHTYSVDRVQPVLPEKQDTVIILSGEEAGQTGSLIGTDGADGIVKVDGDADIKIYPLNSLAKLVT